MTYIQHKVVEGESLSKIARKYGTTVKAIQSANADKIKDVNTIRVGWVLKIPVSKPSESVTNPSKNYEAIGKQVEKALKDIENLESVKTLTMMLEG